MDFDHKPPILAAFGNPLLDMIVKLPDDQLLKQYGLTVDGHVELEDDQLNMFEDIKKYKVEYSAGGCAQNTARIFQWLLGNPGNCVFMGGIGSDDRGKMLEDFVKKAGVITRYAHHATLPTGTCASLIYKEFRSLVAYLGAANMYKPTDLFSTENMDLLSKVCVVYVEGFFITHSFEAVCKLSKYAKENGIVLACNVSGVYVCDKYPAQVSELVKYADIVFGNGEEFKALARVLNLDSESCCSLTKIAAVVSNFTENFDGPLRKRLKLSHVENFGKLVVVTQGKHLVICACRNGIEEYPVPQMSEADIVDTTGAGDAFVAGFIAGLFSRQDITKCVQWGSLTAQQVIKQIGCSVPDYSAAGVLT